MATGVMAEHVHLAVSGRSEDIGTADAEHLEPRLTGGSAVETVGMLVKLIQTRPR